MQYIFRLVTFRLLPRFLSLLWGGSLIAQPRSESKVRPKNLRPNVILTTTLNITVTNGLENQIIFLKGALIGSKSKTTNVKNKIKYDGEFLNQYFFNFVFYYNFFYLFVTIFNIYGFSNVPPCHFLQLITSLRNRDS